MKNRTIIGIVCLVLALVLTFAIAPLVNKMAESKVDIIRLKQDVWLCSAACTSSQ